MLPLFPFSIALIYGASGSVLTLAAASASARVGGETREPDVRDGGDFLFLFFFECDPRLIRQREETFFKKKEKQARQDADAAARRVARFGRRAHEAARDEADVPRPHFSSGAAAAEACEQRASRGGSDADDADKLRRLGRLAPSAAPVRPRQQDSGGTATRSSSSVPCSLWPDSKLREQRRRRRRRCEQQQRCRHRLAALHRLRCRRPWRRLRLGPPRRRRSLLRDDERSRLRHGGSSWERPRRAPREEEAAGPGEEGRLGGADRAPVVEPAAPALGLAGAERKGRRSRDWNRSATSAAAADDERRGQGGRRRRRHPPPLLRGDGRGLPRLLRDRRNEHQHRRRH